MKISIKKLAFSLSAVSLALMASAGWAQTPDECTVVGGITPDFTIAVASNFYTPAQRIVEMFQETEEGDGVVVQVCHNSTGLLVQEINGTGDYVGNANPRGFSLFLAANNTATVVDNTNTATNRIHLSASPIAGSNHTYALGVPVLWSDELSTNKIITANTNNQNNAFMVNKTHVKTLAIGNPALAPYGVKAQAILQDIGQWETPQDPPVNPVTHWITQYDNIDLARLAIIGSGDAFGMNDAGFVSMAQICEKYKLQYIDDDNKPGIHDFGSTYYTIQNGLLISQSTTENNLAAAYYTYLRGNDAQEVLVEDLCYASTTYISSK